MLPLQRSNPQRSSRVEAKPGTRKPPIGETTAPNGATDAGLCTLSFFSSVEKQRKVENVKDSLLFYGSDAIWREPAPPRGH